MKRLDWATLNHECHVETGIYTLDGQPLGARVLIPEALQQQPPYNGSAYDYLQGLREAIFTWGTIEFPGLPLNPTNHTLAQRAPWQHGYSSNPYMTGFYQEPHQDTPPYPTAFWLAQPRRFFATWLMGEEGARAFYRWRLEHPGASLEQQHRALQPELAAQGAALLVNQQPGLILIDNSNARRLYHARTANFTELDRLDEQRPDDSPMFAFNEVGLLHYLDQLDSRRGPGHRDPDEQARIARFMEQEALSDQGW